MSAENVCCYFKFGFCKYGTRCRRRHVEIKCELENCDARNCERRHPAECRFYRVYKRCKYGEYCVYEHINHIDPVFEELKCVRTKLDYLEKELKEKIKQVLEILEHVTVLPPPQLATTSSMSTPTLSAPVRAVAPTPFVSPNPQLDGSTARPSTSQPPRMNFTSQSHPQFGLALDSQ